jgi:hypothetical protein
MINTLTRLHAYTLFWLADRLCQPPAGEALLGHIADKNRIIVPPSGDAPQQLADTSNSIIFAKISRGSVFRDHGFFSHLEKPWLVPWKKVLRSIG